MKLSKNKINSLLLLLGAVGLFLAGCPGKVEYPNCRNNEDCAVEHNGVVGQGVCLFGKCEECTDDAQCTAGSKCRENRCDPPCSSDGDCQADYYCSEGFCRPPCEKDNQCRYGKLCEGKECSTPCLVESDCATGEACVNGFCSKGCADGSTVYFDFNKSDVTDAGQNALNQYGKCLSNNPKWEVKIAGHTDPRGSSGYNMVLGEKRANSVKKYLQRLGVDGSRMNTTSYGKERLAVPGGTSESDYALDRRAVIQGK